MNAPFGQTGTATPLMRSAAPPVPTLPNMKFESRTVRSCSGLGYVTLIRSGPCASGTGGSFGGEGGGMGAGMRGGTMRGTGAGADGPVPGLHDAPAIATQQVKTLSAEAFIFKFQVASAMRYK